MFLAHPQIEPWLTRGALGCRVVLLVDRATDIKVQLRCEPDNEAKLIDMQPAGMDGALHRFECEFPWDHGNSPTVYCFKVIAEQRQHWLAADGRHPRLPHRDAMFRVNRADQPPTWVRDQIFYQIFPDRFCQGDASLAVKDNEYVYRSGNWPVVAKKWGELPNATYPATEFYGGDLIGVRKQLDYLQRELGVTALYLNPIFTSGSNHRYDTEDYYSVDPHLGGNDALVALSDDLHDRGMRLVLDAVVNHTATNHPWFNLHGRHIALGAGQSPDSPWRTWYARDEHDEYVGWNGHKSLPVLDFRSDEVREIVYRGDKAILRHWMRAPYNIDGWRFDVIHMLGEGGGSTNNAHYVRAFRQTLREENAEAYMMGEHFGEATRWLQGDQEDGAMNYYGFASPLREWLAHRDGAYQPARLDTADFADWLHSARGRIPYENQLAQLNLLDSHDTARFFGLLDENVSAMKLAVTLQFAYAGVPCIYYGNEIGITGGNDPDCRRCFDWDRGNWNRELYEHFRSLIALRKSRDEWRHGAIQHLHAEGDVFAFARYGEGKASIVVQNRGHASQTLRLPVWQLPLRSRAWLTLSGHALLPQEGQLEIVVPAHESMIFLADLGH